MQMEKRQQLEEGVVGKDAGGAGGGAERESSLTPPGAIHLALAGSMESREGLARELMRSPSLLHPAGSCRLLAMLPTLVPAGSGQPAQAPRPHLAGPACRWVWGSLA